MTAKRYLLLVFLAAFCILLCNAAYASEDEGGYQDARRMRDYAHASGGALATYGSYGIWKAIMRPEDKGLALLFGVVTSGIVCASKEASDYGGGGNFSGRDLAYCGLGMGAAAVSIPLFGF